MRRNSTKAHQGRNAGIIVGLGICFAAFLLVTQPSDSFASPLLSPYQHGGGQLSSQLRGIPAITPHLAITTFLPDGVGATPAFTSADVTAFVMSYPLGHAHLNGPPNITKVEFIAVQEASKRLNDMTLYRPNDALVCYVTIHTGVTFSGSKGHSASYPAMYAVFDAYTGNLLVVGGDGTRL